MPIPEPHANEPKNDFISRCISSLHKTDPERPDDQIIAICFDAWRSKEMNESDGEAFETDDTVWWVDRIDNDGNRLPPIKGTVVEVDSRRKQLHYTTHVKVQLENGKIDSFDPDSITKVGSQHHQNVVKSLKKLGIELPDGFLTEGLDMNIHSDFVKILSDFIDIFGEEEGRRKYDEMIQAYKIDVTKSYRDQDLMKECWGGICESYNWAKPLIQYLKEDEDAKYYKVRALTATISMNKNDYTNITELERSARTIGYRPLNLNHDPLKKLPFPNSRVVSGEFEDKSVECIIRIANEGYVPNTNYSLKDIQRMLDEGDIVNPSIEAEPEGGHMTSDGRKIPAWYNYTALALLEKGVTLPGVPTTFGFEPLFLNESLGRSLVESLSVERGASLRLETHEKEEKPMSETIDEYLWEDKLGEAKWTRAFINDLPNGSFAVVEPCADENKAARHLPYKDAAGKIDLPHLRNALARMNQIKSVCDGSDEAIRAKAKRKLVPLAKKHLPDSKWAKEELVEGQGIQGMDVCGQCKFFEDLSNTTQSAPAVTGAPTSAEVTISSGAIASGVGLCRVDGEYKTKQCPACTDGRPREQATDLDRVGGVESMNELTMKTQIAELEAELLRVTGERNKEIETTINTTTKLSESETRLKRARKELAVVQENETRHKDEILGLRERTETLKKDNIRFEVHVHGLEKDLELAKARVKSLEEGIETLEKSTAEAQEEKRQTVVRTSEEIEKRVQAQQQTRNAENARIRAVREAVELTEQLSARTKELSDSVTIRSDAAKREFALQKENEELRKKDAKLVEDLRDLKKLIEKLKKKDFDIEISL